MKSDMTPKEAAFLQEYLKDLNGTAAARRMGYREGSAKTIAYRFLHKPQVKDALAKELLKPSPGRVIGELHAIAFSEGSDENGAKVKMTSKLKALELLGKHLGLFDPASQTLPTPVTIIEDIAPKPSPQGEGVCQRADG